MAPANNRAHVQEYFASMNSLSARISSDIRAIEDTIARDHDHDHDEGGGALNKWTYNEKCATIDKYMIDDVIERNTKHRLVNGAQMAKSNRTTSTAASNHLHSLIQAMYPPKPEKYMFEEAGGVWLDEHSGPFSFCKQFQVKCCSLGKGVLQNLAESEPADLIRRHPAPKHEHAHADKKKLKPDMKNKAPQPGSGSNRNSVDLSEQIQPRGIYGVNVMGMGNGSGPVKSSKIKPVQEKHDAGGSDGEEMEDKLPQQKQNLQLIAELQAKLKRTNPTEESKAKFDVEPEARQEENRSSARPEVSGAKQSKFKAKGTKVKKPKAPPPPPPRANANDQKKETVKEEIELKSSGTGFGKHQKAVADQLRNVIAGSVKMLNKHTRKSSNSSPPPVPARMEQPGSSKAAAIQAQAPAPPKPEMRRSNSKNNSKKEDAKSGKAEGGQEFCVDVSSPCRIATPKTGLEFLDNW